MQRREHMPKHLKLKEKRGNKLHDSKKYNNLIKARWLLKKTFKIEPPFGQIGP